MTLSAAGSAQVHDHVWVWQKPSPLILLCNLDKRLAQDEYINRRNILSAGGDEEGFSYGWKSAYLISLQNIRQVSNEQWGWVQAGFSSHKTGLVRSAARGSHFKNTHIIGAVGIVTSYSFSYVWKMTLEWLLLYTSHIICALSEKQKRERKIICSIKYF